MLEQIYPIKLIEKNPSFAFLIGIAYSVIGIGLAVILFPEDPALVAVALVSIMFYPTIKSLLKQEEEIESKKKEYNPLVFLKCHRNIFMVYILIFCGILLSFSYFALILPELATNHIFENQIGVLYGHAVFQQSLFMDIIANNITVLLVIFVTSLVLGDGGIFLLTWNASVWGTIFGNLAKSAANNANQNPIIYFFIIIAVVAPHMLLEAFAYITSAATGGVVSRALIKEKLVGKRFNRIIINTSLSLVFALFLLLFAVIVETYVLGNVEIYRTIIRQSFMR